MAFFGEDGLQRQLKQAQRDLMTKEGQIGSMHLVSKEKDETIKKLRLEVERVREENDELTRARPAESTSSEDYAGDRKRLQAEVKEVRNALEASNMECKQLKEEARLNSIQLHHNRMGASSSTGSRPPSSMSTGRRRSTSLSADTRVQDLEAELKALRETAGSPAAELDALKTQLANVRRDLNKSINEKMALEARARKDVEAVKSQLDDAIFELDAMRRDLEDGGSVPKKEYDRQKKAWEGERRELQAKFGALETQLQERQTEIDGLRSLSSEVSRLNEELDRERDAKGQALTVAPPSSTDSVELERLQSEIASLHTELAQARSQTAASAGSASATTSDLSVRRLQRSLDRAQREIEDLERSLEQSEVENQALRSRVPLPGSPTLKADDGRVAQLQSDNDDLRTDLRNLHEEVEKLHKDIETYEKTVADLRGSQVQLESLKLDVEAKVALLEEKDKALESLRVQVAETETALLAARAETSLAAAELTTATERLSDIQGRLQVTETRIVELQDALNRANESIAANEIREQELKASLDAAQGIVDELQGRPETTTLEAELADVQQIMQRLQTEKIELLQTLSEASKARDDMVDRSTGLTLEIDGLNEKVTSLNEQLEDERDSAGALRSQVAQSAEQVASTRAELDRVSEQLEAAQSSQAAMEARVTELQDTIANRSTESESDARDSELARVRLELHHLTTALSDKEKDLERDVRLLTFTSEQEKKESTARIAVLQQEAEVSRTALAEATNALQQQIQTLEADAQTSEDRIQSLTKEISVVKAELGSVRSLKPTDTASAPSTPDRVGLLYAKIQSLRAERDELRQSLSFAQNESRFTISAAQADRRSALEELQKVKNDIASQTSLQEGLEKEMSAVKAQLDEKETKLQETKALFAGVTVDRGDVDDKISQYENESAAAKAKQAELVQQLQESQQIIIELNHAMALMRSNTETDKRHRKISMDRKSEMSMITETSNGISNEAGPSGTVSFGASRRPGHTRTRSEMAALILPDQAQISTLSSRVAELDTELRALTARLERRNATIGQLQRDNEKLKMAQELNKESAEDFEELVAERDALQETVSRHATELDSLRSEIEAGKAVINANIAKLADYDRTVTSHQEEASTHKATSAQLSQQLASVREEMADLRKESAAHVEKAASSASETDAQIRSLVVNIAVQRKRLAATTTAWRHASWGLRSQTTALETASTQIRAFETERSLMSRQIEAHTQRGKTLDIANEKVRDLEGQLETLQTECADMSEQLDARVEAESQLAAKLKGMSKDREQDVQANAARQKLEESLRDAQDTIKGLEIEIAGARAELSASEVSKDESQITLQSQIDDLRTRLADSERIVAEKTSEIEGLITRLSQAETEAAHLTASSEASTSSVQAELTEARTALGAAQQAVAELEKTRDQLQGGLRELETKLVAVEDSSNDQVSRLETNNAYLQRQLVAEAAKDSELNAKLAELSSQHEVLTTEVNVINAKLVSATMETEAGRAEHKRLEVVISRLEVESQETAGVVAEKDSLIQQEQEKLSVLQKQLQEAKEQIVTTITTLDQRSSELSELKIENNKLQLALAESRAAAVSSDPAALADLRERIEELEASLMAKTQEVDEADDRTREAYKAKVKLEKKIAKLTRQLGEKDTENTKSRSRVLPVGPVSTEGKPITADEKSAVPAHTRTPSGPAGTRAPLRPVSHHESAAQIPLTTPSSLKRHRDADGDEKPLPAEAIMLPPSAPAPILKKTPSRTSFTPKRNISAGSENARSLYGTTAVNTAENRNNIFAPRS